MSSKNILVLVTLLCIAAGIVMVESDLFTTDESRESVGRVIDGDTFETLEGEMVRLLGINTEENGMPHADTAKQKLEELLAGGEVRLEGDVEEEDGYGRTLRYVFAGDTFVNLEMVRQGYAHLYVMEPNTKYLDELKMAEQEAIANNRVLWQPSAFDVNITLFEPVQGSDLINEKITFENMDTTAIDMTGWTLKDEGTHIYRFESVRLGPEASLTVHSGAGNDTSTDLFWDRTQPVWNNDGDVCFLRDSNGLLVVSWRYEVIEGEYIWEKH